MATWSRIFGGWKTWGPNAIIGDGAYSSPSAESLYDAVNVDGAMRLSAYLSCVRLRSETVGSLPLHLRGPDKKIATDHPLYSVLHDSPNAYMTATEYWGWNVQQLDNQGNALSIVQRRRDRSVISLEPVTDVLAQIKRRKSGMLYWDIGGDEYAYEDILHLRAFGTNPLYGSGKLQLGAHILNAQISANEAALRGFKQGLKVGGFFEVERSLTEPELESLKRRLNEYGRSENAGKWMTLLKGMKPHAGDKFRMKPVEAELLSSRYMGIEEICRLCQTPPQLIGHTDKASSWASSLENVNLHFLMYSIQPTVVGIEKRIEKTLVPVQDRGQVQAKFAIQGLLRASMEVQSKMFASALEHGYYNVNEVRDLLDRAAIEGGDEYRVYANTGVGAKEDEGKGDKK